MKPTEKQITRAMNRFENTTDGRNGFYRGCLWYARKVEKALSLTEEPDNWVCVEKKIAQAEKDARLAPDSEYKDGYFQAMSNVAANISEYLQSLPKPPKS
jgi:hypothetical protein